MISKSPDDRQFYEARMKFLCDQAIRLLATREEGRQEGLEEASLLLWLERINCYNSFLAKSETELAELLQRRHDELASLLSGLQARLRSRGE